MTECGQEECGAAESGVCAVHGIEVERRRGVEKMIQVIPSLVKFMYTTIGGFIVVGAIGLSCLCAFLWWIDDIRTDVNIKLDKQAISQKRHEDTYSKKFERTTREVQALTSNMAAYTETNQKLIARIDESNSRAWAIIEDLIQRDKNNQSDNRNESSVGNNRKQYVMQENRYN